MRKKHPIRTFFLLLLAAAMVAGLAALPYLTAAQEEEAIRVSILSGVPERRTLTKVLHSGAPLTAQESVAVEIPAGVQVTEYLTENGRAVKKGDPIARVDDVSVMAAVKAVQESLDDLGSQIQTVRNKIEPGIITTDDQGRLCVNGRQIDESKLSSYTQYLNLSQQHREYEELLLRLFLLHQSGVVTAPCDGVIADVNQSQLMKLGSSSGGKLVLLASNTPMGDDDEVYNGYVRLITGIREDGMWEAKTGTTPCIITDFLDLRDVSLTVSDSVDICQPETVFAYSGGAWNLTVVQPGDILLYAYASDNSYWVIRIGNVPQDSENPTDPTLPTEPDQPPTDPTAPSESTQPTEPEEPTEPTQPGGNPGDHPGENPGGNPGSGQSGSRPSGSGGSFPSGVMGGGYGSQQQQEQTLYSTETAVLCTVTPMDTMSLSLSIDEMDIAALNAGMTAEITLDALPNQTFSGKVTEISPFGTNSGGSSKFAVTLEVPCAQDMLPGMNANVSIVLQAYSDCLTIPVAALTEQGSRTVVFTALDEKSGEPTAPVTVELGFSDGEYVQVLSGIEEDSSFHYTYYDVLEIDTSVETRQSFR